ncbi:MAG: branched-chain amino acid ABC transporter permease [Ilumatobacteraceae bacterium]
MTAAVRAKSAPKTNIDRFLVVIKVVLIGVIAIGLLAFIAQQLAPDNTFAQWTHDGQEAQRLSWPQYRGLIVTGISQGAMYGLIALGYSMVYGVLGFINFAHGEVFMVGAFTGFIMANKLDEAGWWEGGMFIPAIILTIVVCALVSTATAVVMERIAYRPLRGSPRLIPLITSIGISFFIQNAVILLFGPGAKGYPSNPDWLEESIPGVGIEVKKLLVICIAAISMAGLWYFVERTKTGKAMRAVAEDKEIASLMGIDVDKTIVTTFAVGGAMAGIAGILWGILFRSVIATTGFLPGVKAFTAAVVGGVGNLGGAMAGGVSIGSAEALGPLMLLEPLGVKGVSQLSDAVSFTALILVLLIKPSGLFGERLSSEDRA